MVGRYRTEGLGTRLGDHLSDPDTEDEHGHDGSDSTCTRAERLDEINPADNLFVLFLNDGKSGLAEKKLVRFMLRESCTVNHQANERRNADAPDDGHDMKCVHGVPQKKIDVLVRDTHQDHIWVRLRDRRVRQAKNTLKSSLLRALYGNLRWFWSS